MRTVLVEQADAALAVAEGHEVLAEQPYPDRRAVPLRQLAGEQGRDPVPAQGGAHGGAAIDPGQERVVLAREHG